MSLCLDYCWIGALTFVCRLTAPRDRSEIAPGHRQCQGGAVGSEANRTRQRHDFAATIANVYDYRWQTLAAIEVHCWCSHRVLSADDVPRHCGHDVRLAALLSQFLLTQRRKRVDIRCEQSIIITLIHSSTPSLLSIPNLNNMYVVMSYHNR